MANIQNGNYDGQRVMLIVKSPVTLVKMLEMGVQLLPVNIGNMSNRPGTTQYKKSVSMTPEEKAAVDRLLAAGIKVTAQMAGHHRAERPRQSRTCAHPHRAEKLPCQPV